MDAGFWLARWREGKIAWHEGRASSYLVRHAAHLGTGGRVLVPLCGKSEDLAWLAERGHAVVGVELSELAARAFFDEHQLAPREAQQGRFLALAAGGVTILVGDVFSLGAADTAGVTAFYDRAALIALPRRPRARYVELLRARLPAGTPGLLVGFEYEQARMEPPPHAVFADEIRALWADSAVTELDSGPVHHARLGAFALERCYAIRR